MPAIYRPNGPEFQRLLGCICFDLVREMVDIFAVIWQSGGFTAGAGRRVVIPMAASR